MIDAASYGEKEDREHHVVDWDIIAREVTSPPRRFHDDFLQALQPSFMELAAKNSMVLADQLTHFLSREFPTSPSIGHATYARHVVEQIHRMRMEAPVSTANVDQDTFLKHPSTVSNLYISFMELKTALQMPTMISHRLAALDPYALCPAAASPPVSTSVSYRPRPLALPSISSHSSTTNRSSTNREFRANVCKRSRKWLGGPPRPRILVVKGDVVEVFKKGDKKKASTAVLISSIDTVTKSTALELTLRSKDGATLVLTCESPDTLHLCIGEIATNCLVHALDTGQPSSVVKKFIASGARVSGVQGRLTRFLAPQANSLLASTDLIGVAYVVDEKCRVRGVDESRVAALLAAGAPCSPLLRWSFAATFFLRKSPLSRNILDYALQHRLPLDVASDDAAAWSLLQYLCLMRNVSSVERFAEVTRQEDGGALLLRCLQHVNGANDSVLHIVLKPHDHRHNDIGENHATINPITSTERQQQQHGGANDVDAEWIGCLLLQAAISAAASVKTKPSKDHPTNGSNHGMGVVLTMDQPWVNHCDGHGDTLLHTAIKASMWKCVDLLLALHASTTIPDVEGNTAVHLALKMDAPYPLVCRLIRSSVSRTTQRLIEQLSPLTAHGTNRTINPFATTCGGLERVDQHGDTALTLALKRRNEQVVVRLLECGAHPNYHQPSSPPAPQQSDSPLHVAIKTGLPTAAQALVLHGAAWHVKDAQGATPLPLAIRYGMYALAFDLLQALANEQAASSHASLLVDDSTGESVVGLCLKAGQLEVAALVLDLCGPHALHAQHAKTHESPLHYVMKLRLWMDESRSGARQRPTLLPTTSSFAASSAVTDATLPPKPPAQGPKRSRFKSKSDSDIGAMLVGDWTNMTTLHDRHDNGFFVRVLEGMLLGLLKQVDPFLCLAIPAAPDAAAASNNTYHRVSHAYESIVDHHPDWFTPLHAAASGGRPANQVLRWMLLQLERTTSRRDCILRRLGVVAVGPLRETVLHAAIASSSTENAMDVLDFITKARLDDDNDDDLMHLLNATRSDHASALHLVAAEAANAPSTSLELLTRLLQLGVDKEGWNSSGLTPLQVAIEQGASSSWIDRMLEAGCDLNGRAEDGRVPIMVALTTNNHEALQTLLRAGANVKAVLPHTRVGLVDLAKQPHLHPLHPTIMDALDALTRRAQRKAMLTTPLPERKVVEVLPNTRNLHSQPSMSMEDPPRRSLHHMASLPSDAMPPMTELSKAIDRDTDPSANPVAPSGAEKKVQDLQWLLRRLKDEERTTLRLVALEAKQQAREWLTKRIGKQKLLSDSLLLRQQHFADHGLELDAASAHVQAEKMFIERHVADMVSEAKLEIEREKQALLYDATRVSLKEPTWTPPSDGVSKHVRSTTANSTNSTFLLESFIGPHLDPEDDDVDDLDDDDGYLMTIDYARNTLC